MWINSDESDTWTKYKLRQSEWLALAQLCDVLECAETVTLDVQQASSSIADVLFFHRVLRVSLSKQLAKLDNIAANDPAQCLKQAIKAMQLKLSKYERKASANTTIVTASLLHPQHRSKPLAQPPDGESPAALLRSMCDRFVGQVTPATAAPAQGTASKSKYSKYYEDEDEDDIQVASTSTTATTDEVDLYFSDRYPWMESLESHSTKGALAWWKQHTSFFPRLSRLAQTLLAVPSSTAITERGFSHAGIFCSPRRNLGPNSITMLTSSKLLILSGFDPHTASQQDVIPNPPRTSLVTGAASLRHSTESSLRFRQHLPNSVASRTSPRLYKMAGAHRDHAEREVIHSCQCHSLRCVVQLNLKLCLTASWIYTESLVHDASVAPW